MFDHNYNKVSQEASYLNIRPTVEKFPGVNYSLMRGENLVRGKLTRTINHYDLFWGLRAFV